MKHYRIRPGSIAWYAKHIAAAIAAIMFAYIMLCLGFAL